MFNPMFLRPLWIAGRFLSRLPFPDPASTTAAEIGHSVVWYPLIGLLLGAVSASTAWLLTGSATGIAAALVLIVWVWSTGALHLDGSADSADGWVGGLGSRERTLEIMKDPRCGAMGVTVIGLILLTKFAGLQELLAQGEGWLVLWLPLLARVQLNLLLLTTPYARTHGMAFDQAHYLPRRTVWLTSSLIAVSVALILGALGAAFLVTMLIVLVLARRTMLARLNGFTGDTAGALVEITETALLLVAAGAQF
jgi:adenosylcobinamide-GDP ribazoletransferase